MGTEISIIPGKNKVRLVNKRGIDVTEEVNKSIRATLQNQTEEIIGKVKLVDHLGKPLSIVEAVSADVKLTQTIITSRIVSCPSMPVEIPGITAADAFDADDCFGTQVMVKVPKSGILYSATFFDLDDEGTQVDLEIFKSKIAQVASDAAYAPTDAEILELVTELSFFAFDDHGSNRTSEVTNIGKGYNCSGEFWVQAVTRSTPNIAAGQMPRFQFQILTDDVRWKE